MSQDAAPPRVRLHLTITDVGPVGPLRRGAEVMILTEDEDKTPRLIGADSVDAAVDLLAIALKPMIKRLLWGADQPPERRRLADLATAPGAGRAPQDLPGQVEAGGELPLPAPQDLAGQADGPGI